MLTGLILLPVAAALIVALIPSRRREIHLPLGVALSIAPLALAGYLFWVFEPAADYQFVERAVWYEPWGISWYLGVDGISLPMVLLTALLVPIALGASTAITVRTKEFVVYVLFLEAGMIGSFLALDLFLFFVFFEAILIPMYFIIGIWGGERRVYAAVKFFIYTAFGSALMLAAIIALAFNHASQFGAPSFALDDLMNLDLSSGAETLLFAAFALAFAIKVPLFPLHTWLPDAHVEAPTAGSVLLAGVLLKLGTYGLLRFNLGLFPETSVDAVQIMAIVAVIGIIYGAVVAIVQPDLKKLVAYSSVSHLGFIVLGTFALTSGGLQGAVIQNVNHGLTTGALFLLVGMIYERRHTKQIADFGGLQKVMPLFAGFFLFMVFASIGLPGLNGFVGEFLVLDRQLCNPASARSDRRPWGGAGCHLPPLGLRAGVHRGPGQGRQPHLEGPLGARDCPPRSTCGAGSHPGSLSGAPARQDHAFDRGGPRSHRGHDQLRHSGPGTNR